MPTLGAGTQQAIGGRPPQYAPAQACKLTFDRLTLKVVSESRVTWATSVPILVFYVIDLGTMYATDRERDQRASSIYAPLAWPGA